MDPNRRLNLRRTCVGFFLLSMPAISCTSTHPESEATVMTPSDPSQRATESEHDIALPPVVRIAPHDRSHQVRVGAPVRLELSLPTTWESPRTSAGLSWPDVELSRLIARLPRGFQEAITMETKLRTTTLDYTFSRAGTSMVMACFDVPPQRITRFAHRLTYCSKTLIDVADEHGVVPHEVPHMMGKTGEPTELRPIMPPDTLQPGGDFAVKAYAANQSPEGALVTAYRPDGSTHTATTDRSGIAIFSIDQAGPWTFRLEHETNDRSFVADLVFTIHADDSTSAGGPR